MLIQWQGIAIEKLNSLALMQAYQTCLAQEQRREKASAHDKFTNEDVDPITKKVTRPKMEFPPTSQYFLEVKAALLKEINKRNLKLEN